MATLLVLILSAVTPTQLVAQTATDARSVRWRDLSFTLPTDWERITPDPDPKLTDKRIVLGHDAPLHASRILVSELESSQPLTTAEIAAQFFAGNQKVTVDTGALSDWKTGVRTVGGVDYPAQTWRFTPTAGPPVSDNLLLLVFPPDFPQRQRFLGVQLVDTHSGTVPPGAGDDFDSLVASLNVRPVGTVLVADDFSDPDGGALSRARSNDNVDVGYVDGEFSIARTNPDFSGYYLYAPSGASGLADAAISVDAHAVGDDEGAALVALACRSATSKGAYRAEVDMFRSAGKIVHITSDSKVEDLVPWTRTDVIQPGNANHIEFACRGTLLELSVNGQRVAAARHAELIEGGFGIGGGAFANHAGAPVELRFANLAVVQR